MTDLSPAPPPELLNLWMSEDAPWDSDSFGVLTARPSQLYHIATQAARWGADQELEACIAWMAARYGEESHAMRLLRAARRPKPPSLKEQAQRILVENGTTLDGRMELDPDDIAILRRALEQLDD
jgi:hypothetical protein